MSACIVDAAVYLRGSSMCASSLPLASNVKYSGEDKSVTIFVLPLGRLTAAQEHHVRGFCPLTLNKENMYCSFKFDNHNSGELMDM